MVSVFDSSQFDEVSGIPASGTGATVYLRGHGLRFWQDVDSTFQLCCSRQWTGALQFTPALPSSSLGRREGRDLTRGDAADQAGRCGRGKHSLLEHQLLLELTGSFVEDSSLLPREFKREGTCGRQKVRILMPERNL